MKLEFTADDNDLLYDVLNAMFVAQLKNQLKNSREDLAASVLDEDKLANQANIDACRVLLAHYTGKDDE